MKRRIIYQIAFLLIITVLSCSSSMEGDAKALAELQCEATKLAFSTISADEKTLENIEKISRELNELNEKLIKKYDDVDDRKKFQEILMNEVVKCN